MFANLMPSGPTLIVLCILGVILFGRRLPEIGRSLGKGIKEFQNGISGVEDQISDTLTAPEPARPQLTPPTRVASALPRFDDNHVAPEPPPAV
jgi:sec-independent protein translocase protein TatA